MSGKKIRARLHRSLDYERNRYERQVRATEALPLGLLAEAFPEGVWEMHYDGPALVLPYNFALIPAIKDFMILQYPKVLLAREYPIIWEEHGTAAYIINYIFLPNVMLEFRLDSSAKGTTCVLNKIGERTKIIPVYEVTCSDEPW